jgi:hypothetical protein
MNRFKYELVKLAFLPDGQTFTDDQVQSFREAFYRYTEDNGKLDKYFSLSTSSISFLI